MFSNQRLQQIAAGMTDEEVYEFYMAGRDQCTWWFEGDWDHCCREHDILYYNGKTAADRLKADLQLADCVRAQGGAEHAAIAQIMYTGVRLMGWRFFSYDVELSGAEWKLTFNRKMAAGSV